MRTVQKSLRFPSGVAKEIEELAEASGKDFSAAAIELLSEALKMRRCPGIGFADSPTGRHARLLGTGLDVWEIIATHQGLGRDPARLREAYHWLSEDQLRAALGYYAAFPEEIDRRIALNERWTVERLRAQHPSLVVHRS
jgi:uncharacterized protein (DUF433 family)